MMRAVAVFAFVLLLAPASAAEVYRCTTENGVVRYSSTPCTDGEVRKLDIENDPTDAEAVDERIEKRGKKIEALEAAETEADKAAAEAARKAEERQQQCKAARDRLQRLMVARRVTVGEGENRRYLESEEIVQHRQDAQNDVNEFCGK